MQDTAENDERVMTLVRAALRVPAAERAEYLRFACKGAADLYSEVFAAVEWEERMGDFLRRPLIDFIDLEEAQEPEEPLKPGQSISERFVILREVGRGGMGIVYEAFDRKRNQRIAIKCAQPGFGRLLSPELEGALKVRHPNICLVNEIHTTQTEFGELDFLTMEFLEGETLSGRLARGGKLPPDEALEFARQLCAGLAAAHDNGILHRDLKAANVILNRREDGSLRAVITDFGLATEARLDSALDGGTPRYMAPELWRGEKPSRASDVYALGVILYEMVTGQQPFAVDGTAGSSNPAPKSPSTLSKDLDARWDKALLPCFDPAPAARPQADEVLAVFDRRPLWRSPAVAVAVMALVAGTAALWQPIADYFKPSDIRLAMLPVEASDDLAPFGAGVLHDVADRIGRLQKGKATVSVIPLSDLVDANVQTPAQASSVFHATHALKLHLDRRDGGASLHALIIDLHTLKPISDFSAQYLSSNMGDLSGGLAGNISSVLHLGRGAKAAIKGSAAAEYDRGLYFLHRDSYSFDEAIGHFQEAARLDPHSPLPLAALVQAYLIMFKIRQGQYSLEQARFNLRAAEALDFDSVEVRLASGALNRANGNYEKALEDYRRVMELEPHNVEAMLLAGSSYDYAEMADKAEQSYFQAIALDPEYYKVHEYLGAFYYFHGRSLDAAEEFRKETLCAPGRVDAFNNLGGVLSNMGNYHEAEEALRRSLELRENAVALHNLGVVLAYQRRDAEAAGYYGKAIALQSGSYLFRLNLADSERRLGRRVQALATYSAGLQGALAELKNNPLLGLTRAYVAYFKARLGDRAGAEQELAQALHLSPGDNKVIRMAVLTYEALGMREKALAVLSSATPDLLAELNRHPDLAVFCNDPRFKQIEVNHKKGA